MLITHRYIHLNAGESGRDVCDATDIAERHDLLMNDKSRQAARLIGNRKSINAVPYIYQPWRFLLE